MPTGIIPANVIDNVGVWTDYCAFNGTLTNYGIIQDRQVATREGAIMSVDFITKALDGTVRFSECYDLRVAALTRSSDAAVQGAQMWCMVGTKGYSNELYPLIVDRPAQLYWGLNPNTNIPNDPTKHFTLDLGGIGIPFAFHESYDSIYTINTWYTQGAGKQFWAAQHMVPAPIELSTWKPSNTPMCRLYNEAWWTPNQGWAIGGGNVTADGWPAAFDGAMQYWYGGFESHAFQIGSLWWAHQWSPNVWDEQAIEPA